MPDESELLRRHAENRPDSNAAFTEFVRRRAGFVYATALRQTNGDTHTAQDIAQTVFLLASKKAKRLATHEHLGGWLHATTCNIAHTTQRETQRRRAREQKALRMTEIDQEQPARPANSANPAAPAAHADPENLRPLLDDALATLRATEREAVLMRYFDQRPFAEIGAKFKTSGDAARMQVTRSLEKMRATLAKRGVTSTTAALTALMTAESATAATAPATLAPAITSAILATTTATTATATLTTALTTTATTAILALMTSTKTAIITALALLAAATLTSHETHRARAAQTALTSAQRENQTLRRQLSEAERLSHAQLATQPASTASQKAKSLAAELAALHDPIAAGKAFMDANPEFREKMLALNQAHVASSDYLACLAIGMDAAQRAEFEKLRGEYGYGASQLVSPGNGFPRMVLSSFYGDVSDGKNKCDAYLDSIIEGGAKQWADAQKLLGVASYITTPLAQSLYHTGTPLTAVQARQLATICAAFVDPNGQTTTLGADTWDSFIEQARPILGQPQLNALDALKQLAEWQRAQWQAQQSENQGASK